MTTRWDFTNATAQITKIMLVDMGVAQYLIWWGLIVVRGGESFWSMRISFVLIAIFHFQLQFRWYYESNRCLFIHCSSISFVSFVLGGGCAIPFRRNISWRICVRIIFIYLVDCLVYLQIDDTISLNYVYSFDYFFFLLIFHLDVLSFFLFFNFVPPGKQNNFVRHEFDSSYSEVLFDVVGW